MPTSPSEATRQRTPCTLEIQELEMQDHPRLQTSGPSVATEGGACELDSWE